MVLAQTESCVLPPNCTDREQALGILEKVFNGRHPHTAEAARRIYGKYYSDSLPEGLANELTAFPDTLWALQVLFEQPSKSNPKRRERMHAESRRKGRFQHVRFSH